MRNLYCPHGSAKPYSPLDAARHVREAGCLPDGQPIPAHLKATLQVLVTYWPEIRPTLDTLARDTGLKRSTVAEHLRDLHELDLVRTGRSGRTAYRLLQLDRMVRVEPRRRTAQLVS